MDPGEKNSVDMNFLFAIYIFYHASHGATCPVLFSWTGWAPNSSCRMLYEVLQYFVMNIIWKTCRSTLHILILGLPWRVSFNCGLINSHLYWLKLPDSLFLKLLLNSIYFFKHAANNSLLNFPFIIGQNWKCNHNMFQLLQLQVTFNNF